MLRHFRNRLAERCERGAAKSLLVTGRPELLRRIEPFYAASARNAGFSCFEMVDEWRCLAQCLQPAERGLTLAVDVGECATRVYAWQDGRSHAASGRLAVTCAGGGEMGRVIRALMRQRGLEIGDGTSQRILSASTNRGEWPFPVRGVDRVTGYPRTVELSCNELLEALGQVFLPIAESCAAAIAECGAGDGHGMRIVLAGGAAAVAGLPEFLRQRCRAMVELPPEPGGASLRGLAGMLPLPARAHPPVLGAYGSAEKGAQICAQVR
jgi:hypothetical protein